MQLKVNETYMDIEGGSYKIHKIDKGLVTFTYSNGKVERTTQFLTKNLFDYCLAAGTLFPATPAGKLLYANR